MEIAPLPVAVSLNMAINQKIHPEANYSPVDA